MSKKPDPNQPLYDLAGQLGSVNVSPLGTGICVARGANTYSIIFDSTRWEIDTNGVEADYKTIRDVRVGFVVQEGGSFPLSAVISEAQRVFRPKGDSRWEVKNPPEVLTPSEFASQAA